MCRKAIPPRWIRPGLQRGRRAGEAQQRSLLCRPWGRGPAWPPNRRGLVVDGEPGLRDMLSILLRREGLEVTLAPGFVSGCDAVKNTPEPYGVVLTDLVMPDGSGLDLLSLSKQRSPQTE